MKLIIIFYLFLQVVISTQESRLPPIIDEEDNRVIPDSVFTVVAPTVIRQGKRYYVYLRGFDLWDSIYFKITINGTSDNGEELNMRQYTKLSWYRPRKWVSFDTDHIESGTYSLVVKNYDGFIEKRSLTYMRKEFSFFIQFNKAIFSPGDLLQFRLFAVDSETKPFEPKCASTITISDPRGNSIQTFQNVTFKRGKYENSFQLSDKTGLGIWKVEATCDRETATKLFEVAEYVLPLLEAKLTVPSAIPKSNGKVPITVDVSYTSGGDASGPATVKIEKLGSTILTKTINLSSGTATFDINIDDLNVKYETTFQAHLVFEDPLTGTTASDSQTFRILPHSYTFVVKLLSPMAPNSDLKFTIFMKHVDGTPAPPGTEIYLKPNRPYDLQPQNLTIGNDGSVTSSFYIDENESYLSVEITADNALRGNIYAYARTSEGEYCQIDVLTMTPKINEPVEIKIRTGNPVRFVMVHIVSKGRLLRSSKVYFAYDDENKDNDLKTVVYKFSTSFRNSPVTEVIAYYINDSGDFILDTASIRFENDLPNYLTISPAKQEVKPGEDMWLFIESYIGSRVSLVAMDQRLLLLRDGADVDKGSVFADLREYTYRYVKHDYSNLADYERAFGSAGLFVFTNIPRPKRKYQYFPSGPDERADADKSPSRKESSGDVKVREDFRETFLWREVPIYNWLYDPEDYWKGYEIIFEKVPESITTYLIYGVSMSRWDGMGLSDNIPSVNVFLPFFLSADFPYSIKRNEILVQNIILFNYLPKSQTVEVKITKNSGFEAIDPTKYGWEESKSFYIQNVETKVGENINLQFALKSGTIGFVSFEVTARGPLAGDGIKKQLRIIPEGIPRSLTQSVFIALDSNTPEIETTLKCDLPDSAYEDTTSVSATIAGDIFGKALSNLDKLIRMPSGCGEQTMIFLAPNIAIYSYLLASGKLTPELQGTLQRYILGGYQNELKYQRKDGSFSAFGDRDPSGSTWLTAYVVEYFYFAKTMVAIDSNTIKRGADFVVQQQNTDGSFNEPGRVIHSDMQGGSGAGIGLTAYCVIMLTILLPDYPEYKDARDNALKYLEDNYSTGRTLYELGIIAYAFEISNSDEASSAYNMFYALRTETATHLYWAAPAPLPPSRRYYNQPKSLDIEITSYGLLTTIENSGAGVIKIVKYLVSQANNLGGYSSSQDTVMAFYALSQFARTYSANANMKLRLTPDVGDVIFAKVDSSNALALQSFDMNARTREVDILAKTTDSGFAIVSLVCDFYEDPTMVVPVFNVTYNFIYTCTYRMTMDACASFIPKGNSNMAIMIVTLPSGFIFNQRQYQKNPDISKTEIINQGTMAIFYFNSISNKESCARVNAYRSKFVAELKGATIEVYDYYDTSKQGTISYPASGLEGDCRWRR